MAKTLVYQIYLFCFGGRGVSPIVAATQHLKYVKELGVDVVWLGPVFKSPWADHGYDISDHYSIEPRFGTLGEFYQFVRTAHDYGMQVIVDFVPNHASIEHEWFQYPATSKKFFCWSDVDRPGWHNLFNQGPAWQYHETAKKYYLHSFHESQADYNWFPDGPDGDINTLLLKELHKVIDFWTLDYGVDGFRIDIPQSINKDFDAEEMDFSSMLFGDLSVRVLNALFGGGSKDLFLMVECFDPTMGELVEYYADNTPVDFVLNVLIKDEIAQGELRFLGLIDRQAENPHFMLDLESHDAPRFPSRKIATEAEPFYREGTGTDSIWYLFNSGASGICLYNGQELGLDNPTKEELPDHRLIDLDAMTAMRFRRGELLEDLRPLARSNARVALPPEEEYAKQEKNPSSYLNLTMDWIHRWRAK